jgi:arylsulfatase A-like enzyme
MTPNAPARYRAPHWVGLRFGGYLAATELLVVVLPVMYKLRQSGIWGVILISAVMYGLLGLGGGWLLGRLPPLRRRPPVLLLVLLAALTAVTAALGEHVVPVLAFGVPAFGMAWAGTAMAGKPSRLRLALRGVVIAIFGLVWLPLLVPRGGAPAELVVEPAAGVPNLVLVVLDTVRRDTLSTYGHEAETSPRLTELADAGMRFDDARVNGMWSLPSHATFFTGVHPSVHGAHYENWQLEEGQRTLAELLRERGYQTLCVTGNPLISRSLGTARGFEHVGESWRSFWIPESLIGWRLLRPLWDRDRDKGGAASVRFLERWLAEERDPARPLFLFVNIMDPHAPYHDVPRQVTERFLPAGARHGDARRLGSLVFFHHVFGGSVELSDEDRAILRATYAGSVAYGDQVLGQIVDRLDAAGLGDDTLIAVTSDHGELLGEHELWGHVHSLYDTLLAVPLVLRYPAAIAPGTINDDPVQGVDLLPTFLATAGVPPDAWPEASRGRDLSFAWGVDPPTGAAPPVVAEHFTPSMLPETAPDTMAGEPGELFVRRRAVVVGDTKYVVSSSGVEAAFDLAADPGEAVDIGASDPGRAAPARATLSAWVRTLEVPWGDEPEGAGPDVDPQTLQRLRELGYIE